MKKLILLASFAAMPLMAMAQHEEDTENGVVSLAGREGFTISSKKGDFVFKSYLLVQTSANLNWYDDEGLDKAYNQDNFANSGFRCLMRCWALRVRLSEKCLSTYPSMRRPAVVLCCSRPGLTCSSRSSWHCV